MAPNGNGRGWIEIRVLAIVIVLFVILGYAALIIVGILASILGRGWEVAASQETTYVVTALAALLGGAFAAAFGLAVPDTGTGPAAADGRTIRNRDSLARWMPGGGMTFRGRDVARVLADTAVYAYALLGMAAIVVWVVCRGDTVPLVRNLAMTFTGLVPPIFAAFVTFRRVG